LERDSKPAIWSVEYLDEGVAAEILALPADMQGKLARVAELLAAWGPAQVGMPYTRPLGDKLWEIRVSGRGGIARVIYIAASRRRVVLLHAFVKKTQATPPKAIALALRRAEELDR
jgi:phage-related protein